MESSVVLFKPRIHLFACTHPSEPAGRDSSKGDDQQRKTKSHHDSEADKNSIARQTRTPRSLVTARKALMEAGDENMAKELSGRIEDFLKQVQNDQQLKQLEASQKQAKTKHAEVVAAKEMTRIAIKELKKQE